MTTLWQSWFGFWGLLVFASSLIWIGGSIFAHIAQQKMLVGPWNLVTLIMGRLLWIGRTWIPRLLLLTVGLALGWMGRDLKGLRTTYTLTDMLVIAQPGDILNVNGAKVPVPDRTVWIQRTREPIGQAFPFSFCQDYFPELKNGDFIEIVTYEVHSPVNCHDINPAHSSKLGIVYY